jgi:hypothetical protein
MLIGPTKPSLSPVRFEIPKALIRENKKESASLDLCCF